MAVIARSLAEAFSLRATATQLLLPSSPDLACMNMMCEHVGAGCACRLSLALERMPLLAHLDVGDNRLPQLPPALFQLPTLRLLVASSNAITALPAGVGGARALEELDLRHNQLTALPLGALEALPALRRLRLGGNPLPPSLCAALKASPLAARGVLELE